MARPIQRTRGFYSTASAAALLRTSGSFAAGKQRAQMLSKLALQRPREPPRAPLNLSCEVELLARVAATPTGTSNASCAAPPLPAFWSAPRGGLDALAERERPLRS